MYLDFNLLLTNRNLSRITFRLPRWKNIENLTCIFVKNNLEILTSWCGEHIANEWGDLLVLLIVFCKIDILTLLNIKLINTLIKINYSLFTFRRCQDSRSNYMYSTMSKNNSNAMLFKGNFPSCTNLKNFNSLSFFPTSESLSRTSWKTSTTDASWNWKRFF
jgi:hypothetical protein